MKYLFFILAFLIPYLGFAQKGEARKELKAGNKAYLENNFDTAANQYLKAIEKQPKSYKGNFNLGDALYQKSDFDNARKAFENSAQLSTDKIEKANALHNVGNTYMAQKNWEKAINAYKQSLKLSAANNNTIYNLAYAQEMLKKEQDNKDKNKDQDKKEQDKKDKDKKDEDKKDQDKQDQDKKDKDKKDQEKEEEDQRPQPKPSKLTKQEAEKLLNALQQEEKKLHEGEKDTERGAPVQLEKDW